MPNGGNWATRAIGRFGDVINIGVNQATGGLLNQGVGRLMGANSEQIDRANQRMRDNTGLGGDIASGIGTIYTGFRGARAVGQVRAAAPAVAARTRTAAALVPEVGLNNAARFLAGARATGAAAPRAIGANMFRANVGGGAAQRAAMTAANEGTLASAATRLTRPSARTLALGGAAAAGVGGLAALGFSDRQPDTVNVMAPPAVDRTEKNAVKTALAQGAEAPAAITPYEQQMATIAGLLNSDIPAQYTRGLLENLPTPGDTAPTTTETLLGQATLRAQALREKQLELAADPDNEELQLGARVMEDDFNRFLSLAGRNPNNLAQAGMIPGVAEGVE